MPVESATYLNELNTGNPASTDGLVDGDNHLRLIKGAVQASFPNFVGALTSSNAAIDSAVTSINSLVSNGFSSSASTTTPDIKYAGDPNTGLANSAGDQLSIVVGGIETFRAVPTRTTSFVPNRVDHAQTGFTAWHYNAQAQSGSYDAYQYIANVNRSASSAFSHFVATTSNGSNITYNLRGDGNAFADGSWSGGGADYAEWFEWFDTPPEDPIGWVVALKGDKIVLAQEGDEPLGVTSATAGVIGNSAELNWSGKWLRDSFGRFLTTAAGERIRNPAYDPKRPYEPRSARPSWVPVGLLGKLRVRKGQPIPSRWTLLREVDAAVDEYMVR